MEKMWDELSNALSLSQKAVRFQIHTERGI